MATCEVTGITKDLHGDAIGGKLLKFTPIAVTNELIHNAAQDVISSSVALTLGEFSIDLIQGVQYQVDGFFLNIDGGVNVTIPASSTVTLISLVAASAVPDEGMTIKSNGSAFATLIGTLDFSSDFTVTHSPTGEVNVSIAAASLVNPMSALGDSIYGGASGAATRLAGNTTTTRKFLRQTGDGNASAAPTWDTLLAADIPSLSATYSLTSHNHSGVYEPANGNIQSHISNTSNPHSTTFAQLGSKPTTLSGYGITDAQPLDVDLSTVAGLGSALQQLRTNAAGNAVEWFTDSGGGGTPGGSSGQLQYNNGGSFAGSLLQQASTEILFNSAGVFQIGGTNSQFQGFGRSTDSANAYPVALLRADVGSLGYLKLNEIYFQTGSYNSAGAEASIRANTGMFITRAIGLYGWTSGATANQSDSPDTAWGRNAAGVIEANNGTPGTFRDLLARGLRSNAVAFASAIASPVEGTLQAFTDSSTATWGATITGGGSNHVLGYWNGSAWTVVAK